MNKSIRITLDELLSKAGISRYALSKQTGIAFQTIDNYYKNKVVRYDSGVILKICIALNCDVGDMIKIIWE